MGPTICWPPHRSQEGQVEYTIKYYLACVGSSPKHSVAIWTYVELGVNTWHMAMFGGRLPVLERWSGQGVLYQQN